MRRVAETKLTGLPGLLPVLEEGDRVVQVAEGDKRWTPPCPSLGERVRDGVAELAGGEAHMRCLQVFFATATVVALAACGGDATAPTPAPTPDGPPRSFALGFTDWPHARSIEGLDAALGVIRNDGDLFLTHVDDGVPWEEALAGAPYPVGLEEELRRKVASQPPGHVRYLAVTPIAFERDRLAPRRGEGGSEPLQPPWDRLPFDDPIVVEAYAAHCERMIARFDPDYFAYGIEVNMLPFLAPERGPALVRLFAAVYPRIKAAHPSLPVFLTFQVDFLHVARAEQTAAIQELLPYTDVLAASSYAYANDPDPAALRPDHFDALVALAPEKPFAVAETAWPAEDVTAPYPLFIPASEEAQQAYVERLLLDAERLQALFVCWFFTRDYDDFWDDELRHLPDAPLIRLWKDTGLYRGDGSRRPALESWRARLAHPRR